jgi:hypothetical protein
MENALRLRIQSFFFQFMLDDGYLSGKKPDSIPQLPGHVSYTAQYDTIKIIDVWATGTITRGITHILYGGKVVWQMVYEGSYRQEDIPLLKEALSTQYQKGVFRGGRGADLTIGAKVYVNRPEGAFGSFKGYEYIANIAGIPYGRHSYYGGWL